MADYLRVSTSSLKKDAENIEQLKESIPEFIKELNVAMQQLSTCWEGPAWSAYQENVAYHIELLSEIYEYLCGYTNTMCESAEKYSRAEQDIQMSIKLVNTLW